MQMTASTKTILAMTFLIAAAQAQDAPLTTEEKFLFHVRQTASLEFVAETAAYAGVLHAMDVPAEWGQGSTRYGKRVASAAGATALRNIFAFALEAPLREDPRYLRSRSGRILGRIGHVAIETVTTRTDSGRRPLATERIGSAVGAAYLSNEWYPDRLNTFSSAMEQAAATLGLDTLGNLAGEFWPDLKRTIFRRR